MATKRYFGDLGEEFAVKELKKSGLTILARNFKSRFGEIDIVARNEDTLILVEVKTRWSTKFGHPEEAVLAKKLKNIEKTAYYFCGLNKNLPKKLRIDVFAIEVEGGKVKSSKIITVY